MCDGLLFPLFSFKYQASLILFRYDWFEMPVARFLLGSSPISVLYGFPSYNIVEPEDEDVGETFGNTVAHGFLSSHRGFNSTNHLNPKRPSNRAFDIPPACTRRSWYQGNSLLQWYLLSKVVPDTIVTLIIVYFVGANEKVGMRGEVEERKVQFQIRPGRKGKGSQGGANIIHRPHKNHATSLISKSTLSGGTVASLLLLFVLPN